MSEDDPLPPVNVYGASKAAGDSAVKAENPAHLVLRGSRVFGVYGTNFANTTLRLGRVKEMSCTSVPIRSAVRPKHAILPTLS